MRNFEDLVVWQKAHELTLSIYKATTSFPSSEIYGLVSQMRRSASSIATNIAEGCGRNSDAEMSRFLTIATGSCSELHYQLLLAKDLAYLDDATAKELINQVILIRKMIHAFRSKMK